ncbi:hypothetical protein ILP97_47360 [Amycolatopsis sp. H6(2020)]|nr:hypothetical protein [Amycolatopsis sp. H6(2020)]
MLEDEAVRVERLLDAQEKAVELFAAVAERGILRAGVNTLRPYRENPPDPYIAPGSDDPMRRPDRTGRTSHGIPEVHLVDRELGIGGFFEQLLDIGPAAADS